MSYDQESSSHSLASLKLPSHKTGSSGLMTGKGSELALASEEEDEEDNPPAGVDDVDLLDVHLTVEDNGLEIRIE